MAADPTTDRKIRFAVMFAGLVALVVAVLNMPSIIDGFKRGREDAYYTSMRDSCIRTATETAEAGSSDTATIKPKINNYCGCVTDATRVRMPELASLDPNSLDSATRTRLQDIIKSCRQMHDL
jgi:hypothetical protein